MNSESVTWEKLRHGFHIRPREHCGPCYPLWLAYLVVDRPGIDHDLAVLAVTIWQAGDVSALEALEEHTR